MAVVAEPIVWEMSLADARRRAGQEGKPVLIDFSAAPQ
jgi:hypothetical protein